MATIINDENMEYVKKERKVPEYCWSSSADLGKLVQSKNLMFNVRVLEPGKYSYPYHSHRNAEELFVILEGEALLRTPDGIKPVKEGDIVFFEMGPTGAHQLKNNSDKLVKYIDIRTDLGMDVCDYPDSGKVNILPALEIYEKESRVDYFKGEENIKEIW